MINYEDIKVFAKATGQTVRDLLAMSPANDPFYVGTPADLEQAEWFRSLWDRAGYSTGVHLRRVHYWAVGRGDVVLPKPIKQATATAPDGKSDRYMNSIEAWKYLCQASKVARYSGLVDITAVIDAKNPDPIVNANPGLFSRYVEAELPDIDAIRVKSWVAHYDDVMPYLIEVWVEKSTMNDVLEPVCRRFHANLCTFQGEASITAVSDMVKRIQAADRPVRIFYISDFDPAGNSMSKAVARKLEWLAKKRDAGQDIKLQSLVLTPEQVADFDLPRTPLKSSELRADKFEERFGEGGVELDALEAIYPGRLAEIVTEALMPYYSLTTSNEVSKANREARQKAREAIDDLLAKYSEHLDAIRDLFEEINDQVEEISREAIDDFDDRVREKYVAEDPDAWLFDASRRYSEQIGFYKRHAGIDNNRI